MGKTFRDAARLGTGGGAEGDAGAALGVLVVDGSCAGSLTGVVGVEGGNLVDEGVPGRRTGLDARGGLAGTGVAAGVVGVPSLTGCSGFFSGRGVGSSFNITAPSVVDVSVTTPFNGFGFSMLVRGVTKPSSSSLSTGLEMGSGTGSFAGDAVKLGRDVLLGGGAGGGGSRLGGGGGGAAAF